LAASRKITREDLVSLLDQIEGFGNQHIYLFKIPETWLEKLCDINWVKTVFEDHGLIDVYNQYKPLVLPEQPEVISINHSSDWLRIRWVTKREKLELMEERKEADEKKREILVKKFLIRKYRATTMFRVSLITGDAELLIHRLPQGFDYRREKNKYLRRLDEWFGWGVLRHLDLYPAISKIENSGEVRVRDVGVRTVRGSHIDIISPSRKHGIHDDPDAFSARRTIRTGTGSKGNFYWLPDKTGGMLSREVHTIIYRDRVAFLGEYREEEINYVLGRIRHFIE